MKTDCPEPLKISGNGVQTQRFQGILSLESWSGGKKERSSSSPRDSKRTDNVEKKRSPGPRIGKGQFLSLEIRAEMGEIPASGCVTLDH